MKNIIVGLLAVVLLVVGGVAVSVPAEAGASEKTELAKVVYRLYNPNAKGMYEAGAHHYTKNHDEELVPLVDLGWRNEPDSAFYSPSDTYPSKKNRYL